MFRQQLYQNMGLKKGCECFLAALFNHLSQATERPSALKLNRLTGHLIGELIVLSRLAR
jgi:hypothetical protein